MKFKLTLPSLSRLNKLRMFHGLAQIWSGFVQIFTLGRFTAEADCSILAHIITVRYNLKSNNQATNDEIDRIRKHHYDFFRFHKHQE